MATTPEVKIKISADGRGISETVTAVRGSLKKLGSDLSIFQTTAAKALNFSGLGAGLAGLSLGTAIADFSRLSKEISNFSKLSNASPEDFQKMAYAAKTVGVEQNKLSDIFKDVQDKVGDFLETGAGPLADFFQKIAPRVGVTAESFRKLSGPDALQLYVSSLEKANLSQSQMTFYLEAIASDASSLLPLLKNGGQGFRQLADEAQRLGVVFSEKSIEQGKQLSEQIDKLGAISRATGADLGVILIPALTRLGNEYLAARAAGLSLTEAMSNIGLSNPFKSAEDQVKSIQEEIKKIESGFARLSAMSPAEAITAPENLFKKQDEERLATLKKMLDYYERIQELNTKEYVSPEKQQAQEFAKAEKGLMAGYLRLGEVRKKAAKEANEEELKGVERLKAALQSAWQATIDGAQRAREAAAKFVEGGKDKAQSTRDAATDRQAKNLSPVDQERLAVDQTVKAIRASEVAAAGSVIAGYEGNVEKAKKLSEEAAKFADQARGYADKIKDDKLAAEALNKVADQQDAAGQAQAKAKELEAAQLDAQAEAQNQQITLAEDRIKALKTELGQPVSLQADVTAAENEVKRLIGELEGLKDKTVTVTVNTVNATGGQAAQPQGGATASFASGGYTGPGGKFQPAGVVHAGEFVVRSEIVRNAQVRAILEQLNRTGLSALKGYSGGGFVGGASQAPINLHWPDGSVSQVSAEKAVADQIARTFRRAALSRGRRS